MRLSHSMIGRIFHVVFMDHSENVGRTVQCEVFGRLVSYDRKEIVIRSWNVLDPEVQHNNTDYAICRKVIDKCNMLEGRWPCDSKYEAELAKCAATLQKVLPIGKVKAIGLMEVAAGVELLASARDGHRGDRQ